MTPTDGRDGPFWVDTGFSTDGDYFVMCGPKIIERYIWEKDDSGPNARRRVEELNTALFDWLHANGWAGPEKVKELLSLRDFEWRRFLYSEGWSPKEIKRIPSKLRDLEKKHG